MSTKHVGNSEIREAWESGARTRSDLDTIDIVKKGKHAELAATIPNKGAELMDGYVVEHAELSPGRGGWATLTITLIEKDMSSGGTLPVGAVRSLIETDMAQLEKPLLTLTKYSGYAEQIDLWKSADPKLRSQYKYEDADGNEQELLNEALVVAKLHLKGVDSKLEFVPVIVRTTIYKARKDPENTGLIDTPPVTVPGTWQYLKTADRCIQLASKQYQRTEQWTGAKEWSTDLYESS